MRYVTDAYGNPHELFGPYNNLVEVQAANERLGHHFFEESTMRFFGSEVCSGIFYGRLFVTSEQHSPYGEVPGPRLYTVRCARDDGGVSTVGEFQGHPDYDSALDAIHALAKRGTRRLADPRMTARG